MSDNKPKKRRWDMTLPKDPDVPNFNIWDFKDEIKRTREQILNDLYKFDGIPYIKTNIITELKKIKPDKPKENKYQVEQNEFLKDWLEKLTLGE